MLAVTAIDRQFLPGLVALHNSIRRNSPGCHLACLTYGDDSLRGEVEALGIEVRHNEDINAHLPEGEGTEEGCRPMYARLLIPAIYGDAVWLDADQVVLADLSPLKQPFAEPVAAVASYSLSRTVIGIEVPDVDSLYSGLMVFNSQKWREQRITERCIDLMNNSPGVRFRFVVQSVLSVVLAGDFHRLSDEWQGFATRREFRLEGKKVLHWHGRKMKPWTHPSMVNADIWRQYA